MREVAIVGRSCILPGALSPQSLWNLSTHAKVLFEPCRSEKWRADLELICKKQGLKRINMLGSYVHGFEDLFDPEAFALPQKFAGASLDPLFKWILYSAWESLKEAGGDREEDKKNCALILGNSSFPTSSFSSFCERQWLVQNGLSNQQLNKLGLEQQDASERFISGFPALLAKASLGLGGQAFSVDAACASSLYAIKSACDLIQNKKAKLALVGGVHYSDDLFLHMGLSRINALSKQGHCKPFQSDTDGLLPAEGAGFVCLMDLQEAENRGCQIYGLIRGIGISNDGHSHDFLVPRAQGQACAMEQAFEQAICQPEQVAYVECHGTGTLVGDATEIQSLKQVYISRKDPLFLGSLKGNLGHLISASGIAGLIRITEAIKNAQIPPLPFTENPMIQFEGSPFELPGKVTPWESSKPRLAGLSAFGFGGNNAHLIVEEYRRPVKAQGKKSQTTVLTPPYRAEAVAVVAAKMKIGGFEQTQSLVQALFSQGQSPNHSDLKRCSLKRDRLNFNASDLESSLGPHLLALELCMEARSEIAKLNLGKTGVVVGMGLDPQVCRYGFHLRLDDWATRLEQDEDWLRNAKARVANDLSVEGFLGCMPSMLANRFSKQEDFSGPSYAVSAEEHSGGVALDIALEQLRKGAWDAAFVAAVDLASDPIHEQALRAYCKSGTFADSDGGAVLVLKRFTDAIADGDQVHAVMGMGLGEHSDSLDYSLNPDQGFSMTEKFGHTHAASALIHVASAVLSLHYKLKPGGDAWTLSHPKHLRVCKVAIENMLGDTWACTLSEDPATSCMEAPALPKELLEANSREPLKIPYHWPAVHLPPLMPKVIASSLLKGMEEPKAESKSLGKSELPLNLNNRILEVHKAFLNQQKKTHQYFLEYRQKSLETLYSVLPKQIIPSENLDADAEVMPSLEGTSKDHSQSPVMPSPEGTSAHLSQSPVMPSPEGTSGHLPQVNALLAEGPQTRIVSQGFGDDKKAPEELQSKDISWSAEAHHPCVHPRLEYPRYHCSQSKFSKEQVLAFSQGKIFECFGTGYEKTLSHWHTPMISGSQKCLIDQVLVCEREGGPWKRGYLKTQFQLDPDTGFLIDPSKGDPSVPNPLILEAFVQNLAFFMSYLGFTVERDAWRFKLLEKENFSFMQHSELPPNPHLIQYEVFIEELIEKPVPRVDAYILAKLDSINWFLAEKIALELVPDFDLLQGLISEVKELPGESKEFPFDSESLMACAIGAPKSAYPIYQDFPCSRRIPRLPAPPYHFCTLVRSFQGEWGRLQEGAKVEMEYHFDASDWYFTDDGKIPFSILLEIALQPCIWLSSALGSAYISEEDLFLRNLNGKTRLDAEVDAESGIINTKVCLNKISKIASMFVQSFEVACFLDGAREPFFSLSTDFGLLPKQAIENQLGFLTELEENEFLQIASNIQVNLAENPEAYMGGKLRLQANRLLMLDRVTYCDLQGGSQGLGFLVAEKDINAKEWFFRSHFFNDPVMPESLEIEGALQLLRFFCIEKGLAKTAQSPRWELVSIGRENKWKSRGQAEPENQLITYTLNIDELIQKPDQLLVSASASLWVDAKKISVISGISIRIRADGPLWEENFSPELPLSRYFDSECRLSAELIEQINANPYTTKKIFGSCEPRKILFKEYVAHKEGVHPSKIPESFPFNEFPVALSQEGGDLVLVPRDVSKLEASNCLDYWSHTWGLDSWLGKDLLSGLVQRFVHSFYIDEPRSLLALRNKPLIFMTNQQVGVESLIFSQLMGAYLQRPLASVFRQEHQMPWIRDLLNFLNSYPSISLPEQELKILVPRRGASDECYAPILNGVLAKQAVSLPTIGFEENSQAGATTKAAKALLANINDQGFHIVPVGFFGALPEHSLDKKLGFPYAMSKQKILVGKPIASEQLLPCSLEQRIQLITDAIKNLDKKGEQGELLWVDEPFGRLVHSWMLSSRVKVEQAVLFCTLREMLEKGMKVSSQTQRLVEARLNGVLKPLDDPEIHAWLERMSRWLMGRKYLS